MNGTYVWPERRIAQMEACDVLVAGGGPAGCSAALAAARRGCDVVLVEKDGFLGGAVVSQTVCAVLSTNCNDFEGIWFEYADALRRRNAIGKLALYPGFDYIWKAVVNPEAVKIIWEEMLLRAGVRLLYHSFVSDVHIEDGRIRAVRLETKAGGGVMRAERVIDCTGDGMVANAAGVPWQQGDGANLYAMACTKMFSLENVKAEIGNDTGELLTEDEREALLKSWREYAAQNAPGLVKTGYEPNMRKILGSAVPGSVRVNMAVSRVLRVDPLNPWDLTRAEIEGREQAWHVAAFLARYMPARKDALLSATSNHMGVRSSRRVKGMHSLTADDVISFRSQPDGIAQGAWDIDIWPADSYTKMPVVREDEAYKKRIELMRRGATYDIPYGCLVADGLSNLLVAGRCISADHIAQSSLRIQQTCMSTGQAAGTAAAVSLRAGTELPELEVEPLRQILRKDREDAKERYGGAVLPEK